jgi:ribosomal protein S18 acetylase RimI-like enzyme
MIEIRPAIVGDEEGIAHVHVKTWQESYKNIVSQDYLDAINLADKVNMWREVIAKTQDADKRVGLCVAMNNDEIIGFISLSKSRKEGAVTEHGEVTALYIDPDYQGKGVGKKLLDHGFTWLKEHGFANVMIRTLEMADSTKFYVKNKGILQADKITRQFGDGKECYVVEFRWDL